MNTLSNSLKELGFTINPGSGKDADGNDWVLEVTPPSIHVKLTKRGKLKAFKSKADKIETAIAGMYGFVEQDGDLVGKRPTPAKKQPVAA